MDEFDDFSDVSSGGADEERAEWADALGEVDGDGGGLPETRDEWADALGQWADSFEGGADAIEELLGSLYDPSLDEDADPDYDDVIADYDVDSDFYLE
jgi:hypothetical protein